MTEITINKTYVRFSDYRNYSWLIGGNIEVHENISKSGVRTLEFIEVTYNKKTPYPETKLLSKGHWAIDLFKAKEHLITSWKCTDYIPPRWMNCNDSLKQSIIDFAILKVCFINTFGLPPGTYKFEAYDRVNNIRITYNLTLTGNIDTKYILSPEDLYYKLVVSKNK